MTEARSPRNGTRPYTKSGIHTLKKAVRKLGSRALPSKSTALGRSLHEWRTSLVADLGGADAVSTAQLTLIELAVRTRLLVDSIDAYILSMESGPVNKRRRCLHPVVRERGSLVNQLQSLLRDLGLERRTRPFDLAVELAALHQQPAPTTPAPSADTAADTDG